MNTLLGLAAAALGVLIGMAVTWPFLKRQASSKEAQAKRWKMLWTGGLICWIGAVILVQVVGHLREQVEAIDRDSDTRMRQIDAQYQQRLQHK